MWQQHRVFIFSGSRDTKKYTGNQYNTISLAEIFNSEPQSVDKEDAMAFVPSSYNGFDARTHDVQKNHGEYVALAIDVDNGNLSFEVVQDAIRKFAGEAAVFIYSSSSSSEQEKKWRGIIPLEKAAKFSLWEELQLSFFDFFKSETNISPDMALARAAQPVYLPNVPENKRDALGDPEFYQSEFFDGIGLNPSCGSVKQALQIFRKNCEEDEQRHSQLREEAKAQMQQRSARYPSQDNTNIIDEFNKNNTVESMLLANGYERRGKGDSWRSPYQSTSSYATKNFGEYWVSLSESDSKAGIGRMKSGRASSYCFGDSFDIYCHFMHGGDLKAAVKAIAAEIKSEHRKDLTRFDHKRSAVEDFGVVVSHKEDVRAGDVHGLDQPKVVEVDQSIGPIKMPEPIKTDPNILRQVMEKMDLVTDLNEMMTSIPEWVSEQKGLDQFACETIAGHYRRNMKRLGATISIKSCREIMLTKEILKYKSDIEKSRRSRFSNEIDTNEMLTNWVYLTKHNTFYNLIDGREIDSKAFDLIYAPQVPIQPGDDRPQTATRFFSICEGRSVYHQMYVPALWSSERGGQFFRHENIDYLNSYMGNKLPVSSNDWASREHWATVRDHIYNLMSCDAEAEMMIKWMAHNVQYPGLKILWAPVILGPQGAGKTTIERIMSSVMGQQNVRTISLDEIYSSFTGWAEGACVRFIEEIRIAGHSRHDVMNKLKPYLTNERVTVVRKGRDGVDVLNTQNYACFTNHKDAIVVDKEDRRYGVFRTKAITRQDVELMFDKEYWDRLYEAINNYAGDIRSWLLSIDLSEFNRVAAPPMTTAKIQMIKETRNEDEANLDEVLSQTAYGVTKNVVVTTFVNDALRACGFRTLSSQKINSVLAALGFQQFCDTVFWDGKTRRVMCSTSWLEANGSAQNHDDYLETKRVKELIRQEMDKTKATHFDE